MGLFIALILPQLGHTDELYSCTYGSNIRKIIVQYDDQDTQLPCRVVYLKGSSNVVLWSANNELGYCDARAREFSKKQMKWGWKCEGPSSVLPKELARDKSENDRH